MKESRIATNFVFNAALTLSSYVFNLILFPYVSRVLGVETLGKVGFVSDTVTYFSLFAMMGISTVGIREVAACRNDRNRLDSVFSSLVALLGITTALVFLVYFVSVLSVGRFAEEKDLMFIGAGTLIFSSFMIEWLYQGLENFRFVTLRSILVRSLYVVAVFLTVKEASDYRLYFGLTVLSVVLNALINLLYSRKFVSFSFRNIRIQPFLKPFLSLGAYKIMVSMYTTFNVVYLGFVASDMEVGCYYTSNKLFYLILGIFSAFTGVMLPRMSSMLAENDDDEFRRKTAQSFDLLFSLAFPIVIYCVILAPQIIRILSGAGFEGAVLPMRIISPVLLLSGMAQIWVIQVMLPLRKDRIVLLSSIIGAVVGITANFLLVGTLKAVGSALVLLISEICGNVFCFVYAIRKGYLVFPLRSFLIYLAGSIPYVLFCLLGLLVSDSHWIVLILAGGFGVIYYLVFNLLYRESAVSSFIRFFLRLQP